MSQNVDTLILIEAINAAPAPMSRGPLRREDRKVQAKAVRSLFKDLGIKGVSVTAPSYSMASSIHVEVPSLGCKHNSPEEWRECTGCQMRHKAIDTLEGLILKAYPDMNDRSDSRSDYFDYRISMGS